MPFCQNTMENRNCNDYNSCLNTISEERKNSRGRAKRQLNNEFRNFKRNCKPFNNRQCRNFERQNNCNSSSCLDSASDSEDIFRFETGCLNAPSPSPATQTVTVQAPAPPPVNTVTGVAGLDDPQEFCRVLDNRVGYSFTQNTFGIPQSDPVYPDMVQDYVSRRLPGVLNSVEQETNVNFDITLNTLSECQNFRTMNSYERISAGL